MRSAGSASGERFLVFLLCSYASFTMVTYIRLRQILKPIPLDIPFKGLAILGGFTVVFWVVLAKELCGRWYGVLTSLTSISMCLLVSPWFGVVNPPWFSVIGFLSFLILGLVTETISGALGNLSCLLMNWISSYLLGIARFSFPGLILFSAIAALSGYAGERLARLTVRVMSPAT